MNHFEDKKYKLPWRILNNSKLKWILSAILLGGISFLGGSEYDYQKSEKSIIDNPKSKLEKNLRFVENKFTLTDSLTPKDSISLEYFKQDCYLLINLMNGSISSDDIYNQLKQRAKN